MGEMLTYMNAPVSIPLWAAFPFPVLCVVLIVMTAWFDRWSHRRLDEATLLYQEAERVWGEVNAMLDDDDANQK